VVPADNKAAARVIVATILLENLQRYKDIKEPELEPEVKENLDLYIKQLQSEKE
jgi:hypothetical protein